MFVPCLDASREEPALSRKKRTVSIVAIIMLMRKGNCEANTSFGSFVSAVPYETVHMQDLGYSICTVQLPIIEN